MGYYINFPGAGKYSIVFNQNTYGFEEVINTFCDSEEIYIITYSINPELLKKLYVLNGKQRIFIVTNDPYIKVKKDGSHTIKDPTLYKLYEHAISKENFKVETETYFNYKNHSKIVMTDKLAYIGSQNFYGATSFETGVLLSDKTCIEHVKDEVVDKIIMHSNPYSISRDLYQLYEVIEYTKRVKRIFEEPLSEADFDSRENNVDREKLLISKRGIKKIYEIMLAMHDLLAPVDSIDDLKNLLKLSIKLLNASFFISDDIKSIVETVKLDKSATYEDLIKAVIGYIISFKEDFLLLSIKNVEETIELLDELSDLVETFIINHFRFFEYK